MQLSIGELVIGHATLVRHHHPTYSPLPTHTPPTDQNSDYSTFPILQLNANGIGNKLTEQSSNGEQQSQSGGDNNNNMYLKSNIQCT